MGNKITESMNQFDWYQAMTLLRSYFWGTFCDKHIENSKKNPCNLTLNNIFTEMLNIFEIFFPDIKTRLNN